MEKDSFKILEYSKIKDMLAERASSRLGRELAEQLQPSSDSSEVEEWLSETAQASLVLETGTPPLGGIRDIRELLKKVRKGAALDLAELQDVQSTLYAMRQVKYFFRDSELEVPALKDWAHAIEILGQLERHIDNIVDEHGNMRETASVELARIRRELRQSQNTIKERVNGILHAAEYQKYFQDAIVTVRDDRYCIPIKAEYRSRFPGLIHDRSASGSTLFIEPMAVVELNNDIKQLELAEQQEVARIMRDISREIGKNSETLLDNCSILADLDFAFAKARLAADMGAVRPVLNQDGITRIYGARHPLIPRNKVVPIDIQLGDGYKMLLVTGPNTGGKTVSMKTLGLIVLMVQSGCYMPADPGSEIAVYDNLYADIGDEQSIEQSLSTFSAHMTNIVHILSQVEQHDLVLLDELGAGTDPEEGAALAMAILEHLLHVDCTTMATTHYSELKTFAYSTAGVENASVEFDVKTLRPTYRLLIGIPGASNAFAISRRLGLNQSLILRAKELIASDHAQFEQVVNELEHERTLYEQKNAEIRERQQHVEQMEKKIAAVKEEIDHKRNELLKRARERSAALVRRTRRESEDVIKELKEQFDDQGIKARQRAIQEARARLNKAFEQAQPGIMPEKVGKRISLHKLQPGDTVYVKKLAQKGTVLEISGKELTVQLGVLRTKVKASGCTFVAHAAKEEAPGKTVRSAQASGMLTKTAQAHRELDIRGMMVDEAEVVVGKFIDDAQIAGLSQILIIHGKGTGALRKGIHENLRHHKSVQSFTLADIDEGGSGATVVNLK